MPGLRVRQSHPKRLIPGLGHLGVARPQCACMGQQGRGQVGPVRVDLGLRQFDLHKAQRRAGFDVHQLTV